MTQRSLNALFDEHRGKVFDKREHCLNMFESLFEPLRRKSLRILEISIQNSGSLEIGADQWGISLRRLILPTQFCIRRRYSTATGASFGLRHLAGTVDANWSGLPVISWTHARRWVIAYAISPRRIIRPRAKQSGRNAKAASRTLQHLNIASLDEGE
jgi:hypothetical protein